MQQALLDYEHKQFPKALQNSIESLLIAKELGPTEIDVDLMTTNGYCHLALEHIDEAQCAFQSALDDAEDLANPVKKVEAL